MVRDLFSTILAEIGEALKIPDLHPDQSNSCLINLASGVKIQIEIDKKGDSILIGSELGTIHQGRYRENVFREALKANGMPHPLHGIIAYSKNADKIVLFEKIPLKDYHIEKVIAMLPPFLEKAKTWRDALARGDVPIVSYTSSSSSGMFGLRR